MKFVKVQEESIKGILQRSFCWMDKFLSAPVALQPLRLRDVSHHHVDP